MKIFIIIIVVLLLIILLSIRKVPPRTIYITEVLGMYHNTWKEGIYFKIPLFEKIVGSIDTTQQTLRFGICPIVLKNNEILNIEFDVLYYITNPISFYYSDKEPTNKIKSKILTCIRDYFENIDKSDVDSLENISEHFTHIFDDMSYDLKLLGIRVPSVKIHNIYQN